MLIEEVLLDRLVHWIRELPLPLQLLAFAVLAGAGSGILALGIEEQIHELVAIGCVVLGGALAVLVLAALSVLIHLVSLLERVLGGRRRLLQLAAVLAVLLLVPGGIIGWQKASWHQVGLHCERAQREPTLQARQDALAEARRDMASGVLFLPPDLLDEYAPSACLDAEAELEALEEGRCPVRVLDGVPCTCGEERWPEDWESAFIQACCWDRGDEAGLSGC